jgi:hypothetical protein
LRKSRVDSKSRRHIYFLRDGKSGKAEVNLSASVSISGQVANLERLTARLRHGDFKKMESMVSNGSVLGIEIGLEQAPFVFLFYFFRI